MSLLFYIGIAISIILFLLLGILMGFGIDGVIKNTKNPRPLSTNGGPRFYELTIEKTQNIYKDIN